MNNKNLKSSLKFGILITLIVFSSFLFIFGNTFRTQNYIENSKINSSAIESPIFIDATATGVGAHNWTWAKNQTWCNGEGTWNDRYTIEDLIIDAGWNEYCIKIENSNAFFKIENCTLYGSGADTDIDAGIKLVNTSNGMLINNDCSNNNRMMGIFLRSSCNNNTIINNTIFESSYVTFSLRYGIRIMDYCDENKILNNNIDGIYRITGKETAGISIENNCDLNLVQGNLVNDCWDNGIYVYNYSEGNIITENILSENSGYGVLFDTYCHNNEVFNNTAIENSAGIGFKEECYNNNIYHNNASYNSYYGIRLLGDCEYFGIYNNTCDSNEYGIVIDGDIHGDSYGGSKYIDIEFNNLSYNSDYAIYLDMPNDLNLNANKMYGSGINFYEGLNNNQIPIHSDVYIPTNNTVNNKPIYFFLDVDGLTSLDFPNAGQILLVNCSNAVLENLNFADCSVGIHMHWCDNAIIRNVTVNDSTIGIELVYCDDYNISETITNRNQNIGLELTRSFYGEIKNCTSNENAYGIDLYNNNFTTITNIIAEYNNRQGIYLGGTYNCEIKNCNANRNGGDGIFFNGGGNNTLCNNDLLENNQSGVVIWYGNHYFNVTDNIIGYNSEYGVYLNRDVDYSHITNNKIFNNLKDGIYVYFDSDFNTIFNNSIYNNSENGIYIYDYDNPDSTNNNIINKNTIFNNALNGIRIYRDCHNNEIFNNTIYTNGENGIELYNNCDNNSVSENTINSNGENGIIINDMCDNNNITLNEIHNNDLHSIYLFNSENLLISENNMSMGGIYFNTNTNLYKIATHQIDLTNYLNNKVVYYYEEQSGLDAVEFINAGQIILYNCSNANIDNEDLSYGSLGISLYYCVNISMNEVISSFNVEYGIYVYNSTNIDILGCIIENNTYGILIDDGYNNYNFNITDNQIQNSLYAGIKASNLYDSIISNNQINFNALDYDYNYFAGLYISSSSNIEISLNNLSYNYYDGLYISGSSNIEISLNNLSYNYYNGLYIGYSSFNDIIQNTIEFNLENGIYLSSGSDSNNISINIISNNLDNGIYIGDDCYSNIIEKNNIAFNQNNGVYYLTFVGWSNSNILTYNRITDNILHGIYLVNVLNMTITFNLIQSNGEIGLLLEFSENCTVCNNTFVGNSINAMDNGTYNTWDNGEFGNYWNDYTGVDADNNGIGDTPYDIEGSAGAIDNYPLMDPTQVPNPNTPPGENNFDLFIMLIIIFIGITASSLVIFGITKHFTGKSNKNLKEPKLETYSNESIEQGNVAQNIRQPQPRYNEPSNLLDNYTSSNANKNYQAITNRRPELKEYLETDKLLSELPEMDNFITSLSNPELMRKINLLKLTLEERGLLLEDLVNLKPEERTKLIDKMLRNL